MLELIPFLSQLFNILSPQIQSVIPLVAAAGAGGAGAAGAGAAGGAGGIGGIASVGSLIGGGGGKGGGKGGGIPKGLAVTGTVGVIQGIQSIIARKRAKGLEPPLVDVSQARALADIRRRRRTFETGTAITPFVRPIRQVQAQATLGALRAGAGQAGISRAQRIAGTQISDLVTRGQQRAQQLADQELQQQNLISARILGLQRSRQFKEEARAFRLAQSGLSNILTTTSGGKPPGQPGQNG